MLKTLTDCSAESVDVKACVTELVGTAGTRIWRRPATAEEVTALAELGEKASDALDGTFTELSMFRRLCRNLLFPVPCRRGRGRWRRDDDTQAGKLLLACRFL